MPTETGESLTSAINAESSLHNEDLELVLKGLHSEIVTLQSRQIVTVSRDGSGDYNCDGVADEVQINAAITAVNAAGGGIVHIKAGTYNCAANVVPLSNVILEGEGEATSCVFTTTLTSFRAASQNNFIVRYLKIDESGQTTGFAATSNEHSFKVYNCQNFKIYGLHIEAYGFGIFLATQLSSPIQQTCSNGEIYCNYIHGRCGNDLIGGGPNTDSDLATRDLNIHHNFIAQDVSGAVHGTYSTAFDITGGQAIKFEHNISYGTIMLGRERDPDSTSAMNYNHVYPVIGSPIIGTLTSGAEIRISDDLNSGDVSGKNHIIGNYLYGGGIYIFGLTGQHIVGGIIADNIVENDASYTSTSQSGIRLQYADQFQIHGNQLWGHATTGGWGITLIDSLNCNVGDCYIDGYPVGLQASGVSTGHNFHDCYLSNNTATIGSAVLTGVGNSISDNYGINPNCLVNALGNVSGTVTFDRATGDLITCVATGNITTTTLPITRVPTGSRLTIQITQDATGSRTVAKPGNAILVGGAMSPSAGANAVDSWTFVYNGTKWQEVSRALNVS